MASQESDELSLLALVASLALAKDRSADEVGILAGFASSLGSILALIAVVLAVENTQQERKKAKEGEEKLAKRLEKIEEELKALKDCCEAKASKPKG